MRIRHTVEKPDGTVVFQGVLEGAELNVVIEMGLNTLLANGMFPFMVDDEENGGDKFDYARVMPANDTEQ